MQFEEMATKQERNGTDCWRIFMTQTSSRAFVGALDVALMQYHAVLFEPLLDIERLRLG